MQRADIGSPMWWQCLFYSQRGLWLSSNFWELSAQLLQVLHYWLKLGKILASLMCTKCLIYHKLLLGWLIFALTHSPHCLQMFPRTQRNSFLFIEAYIFISWALICQRSSRWANIFCSYSGVLSLVTCPHLEISKSVPTRDACTEITQMNVMD